MSSMRPRERVLTALAHEEPDRVPIIFGVNLNTSMVRPTYEGLKAALGVQTPTGYLYYEQLGVATVKIDEAILRRMGSDGRGLQDRLPAAIRQRDAAQPSPEVHFNDWGVGAVRTDEGSWFQTIHPLQEASLDDLEDFAWPDMRDATRWDGLVDRARQLAAEGEYAIFGAPLHIYPFERAISLRGMEQFMIDLVLNQDFSHALLGRITELFKAYLQGYLGLVGAYLDVICIGDDLGQQTSLLVSPQTYRQMIKPYHADLIAYIRERTAAKIFYHSDGDVEPLIGDLIEIGIDILNPIQTSSGRMADLVSLKRNYGAKLTFCGAIDTHEILPHRSPAEVRDEVRRAISILGPGGGYLLSSVHAMQKDVPPENVLAMCDAARDDGRYPLP